MLFISAFLLLTCGIVANGFRTVDMQAFRLFQADSQALVERKTVDVAATRRMEPGAGFLRRSTEFAERRLAGSTDWWATADSELYRSQFGLQGLVATVAQRVSPLPPAETCRILEGVTGALLALGLAVYLRDVRAHGGSAAGWLGLAFLLFAPALILGGRNLYWVPITQLAPMIVAHRCYFAGRSATPPNGQVAIWVGAAVFLKCLCGYEFITGILLSTVVVVMAAVVAGRLRGFSRVTRALVVVSLAGLCGFALAMLLHWIYIRALTGSAEAAFGSIFGRAVSHIAATDSGGAPVKYQAGLTGVVLMVTKYLSLPGVFLGMNVPFGEKRYELVSMSFAGVAACLGIVTGTILALTRDWRRACGALAVLLAGLGCAISWLLCAHGHALNHFHLDSMAFLPFLASVPLSLALLLGEGLEKPGS